MKRVEATIPEMRFRQLVELCGETGWTRSRVINEALSLWLRSIAEAKQGRRTAFVSRVGFAEWSSPAHERVAEWRRRR